MGPGLVPCLTRPESRSFSVDAGTPNALAARFAPISPDRTASIACIIESSDQFLSVLGRLGGDLLLLNLLFFHPSVAAFALFRFPGMFS